MTVLSALVWCGRASIQDGKASIVLLQVLFVAGIIGLRIFKVSDEPLEFLKDIEFFKDKILICRQNGDATDMDSHEECMKIQLAYRWAWSVAGLFLTLMLVTICGLGAKALTACFFIKLLTPVAIFFGLIFVPDMFFNYLLYIGGFASGVAYVFVFVFLLSFGVKWNNSWTRKMTEDKSEGKSGCSWVFGILFFSFLFFGASVGGLVMLVKDDWNGHTLQDVKNFLGPDDLLNSRRGLVVGTFVVMLVCTLFSILSCVKHGGILTSTLIMAFLMTLCWGATLNNKYDILDIDHNLSELVVYLGLMSAWAFVGLVTSVRERRSTKGGVEINVDETDDIPKEGGSPKVSTFWTMLFFLLHAGIPVAIMSLVSERPGKDSDNVQFWIYSVVIGLCLVLNVLYLILPLMCLSRREFE